MLSLLASQIAHNGEDAAKAWAQGLKDNLAREPQGGDTDQLKGIASGECAIALSNTYYFVRAVTGSVDGLSDAIDRIGIVFPDQGGNGAHVNISGAAVTTHAPHRENAVKFIEYLTSDSAQGYFANGNNEYPVVEGVEANSAVEGWAASRPTISTFRRSAKTRPAPRKSTTRWATSKLLYATVQFPPGAMTVRPRET
jgi:iron(III) transport system substrate-binding protein